MADIDAMMAKIAKLIDTAESFQRDGNAGAAKTYRTKAEQLMRDYRVEEEQLIRESVSSGAPVWKQIWIGPKHNNEWLDKSHTMFYSIAEHCGVKYKLVWGHDSSGRGYMADAVGYEIDLRLLEMIFNAARLAFFAKLEPEYDVSLSAEENIYRLRGSGMDRQKVAEKVFGQKGHAEGIKVGKIYRAECERRGEVDGVSGRGFNREAYRTAYAQQFVVTINRRLRDARDAADSHGGALVLPQRAERVAEALYAKYPDERPWTAEQWAAYEEQRKQAEANMTEAERKQREKDRQRLARQTKAQQRETYRLHYSPQAQRARAAGAEAAQGVDLTREAPRANRTEAAPNRTALGG